MRPASDPVWTALARQTAAQRRTAIGRERSAQRDPDRYQDDTQSLWYGTTASTSDAVTYQDSETGEWHDAITLDQQGSDVVAVKPRAIGSDPDWQSYRLVIGTGGSEAFRIADERPTTADFRAAGCDPRRIIGPNEALAETGPFSVARCENGGAPRKVGSKSRDGSGAQPMTAHSDGYWMPCQRGTRPDDAPLVTYKCIALDGARWSLADQLQHASDQDDREHVRRNEYRRAWVKLTDRAYFMAAALMTSYHSTPDAALWTTQTLPGGRTVDVLRSKWRRYIPNVRDVLALPWSVVDAISAGAGTYHLTTGGTLTLALSESGALVGAVSFTGGEPYGGAFGASNPRAAANAIRRRRIAWTAARAAALAALAERAAAQRAAAAAQHADAAAAIAEH